MTQSVGFHASVPFCQGKEPPPHFLRSMSILRQGMRKGCLTVEETLLRRHLPPASPQVFSWELTEYGTHCHNALQRTSHSFKKCSDVMETNKVNKLRADTGGSFELASPGSLGSACI